MIELFEKKPKGKKSKFSPSPPKEKSVELSFVGSFPTAWDKYPQRDMLASLGINGPVDYKRYPYLNGAEWSPGTEDFKVFALTGHRKGDPAPIETVNLDGLLYEIGKRKPSTVHRVYLFTHAEKDYIGLSGETRLDSPYFTGAGITKEEIFTAEEDNKVFGNKKLSKEQMYAQDINLGRVRAAFEKDAEVIIFGCHSGASPDLLERMSKMLGVKVRGFKEELRFTLHTDSNHLKITKRTYGVKNGITEYKSFRDMIGLAFPK